MKTIKVCEIIDFIDKIKDDENWIGTEYECYNIPYQYLSFVREHFNSWDLDYRISRDELECVLFDLIYDFNDNKNNDCANFELDDLRALDKLLIKELLPIWTDNTIKYCNIGKLVDTYGLDLDELYFDGDCNCIRDKDGNIWFD